MPEWKLELWPGYVTSIRQHEHNLLLCTDLSNKIIRTDSVLDEMRTIYKQASQTRTDAATAVKKLLIGETIMTKYNNRTYRIDDIAFDLNPMDTFKVNFNNAIQTPNMQCYFIPRRVTARIFLMLSISESVTILMLGTQNNPCWCLDPRKLLNDVVLKKI
jgi:hypothetical protein